MADVHCKRCRSVVFVKNGIVREHQRYPTLSRPVSSPIRSQFAQPRHVDLSLRLLHHLREPANFQRYQRVALSIYG